MTVSYCLTGIFQVKHEGALETERPGPKGLGFPYHTWIDLTVL